MSHTMIVAEGVDRPHGPGFGVRVPTLVDLGREVAAHKERESAENLPVDEQPVPEEPT